MDSNGKLEKIILAPGANSTELLRSLSKKGKNSIGLRIMNALELADYALIKSGVVYNSRYISLSDQSTIIYSILSEADIPYFKSASYTDAENIATALNNLRRLLPTDEKSGIESVLNRGVFTKKNDALLLIYDEYMNICWQQNVSDGISKIRSAIELTNPLDVEITILDEFELSPLEIELAGRITDKINHSTIAELFGADTENGISVETFTTAYGASNEAEDIIGRIFEDNIPIDKCVVAVADIKTYSQLFYDISERYSIPVTFGCGVSILNTNPARLLDKLYKWHTTGCCGTDALTELMNSTAFITKQFIELFEDYGDFRKALKIAGRLRLGMDSAVNKERIENYRNSLSSDDEKAKKNAGLLPGIEKIFSEFEKGYGYIISKYSFIRSGEEGQLDLAAVNVIHDAIESLTKYSGSSIDEIEKMIPLILQKRVRTQNSMEGALHICSIKNALSTVRDNLYIAGLGADIFPGKPRENYLLLDDDYQGIADAPTSEKKINDKKLSLERLLKLYSSLHLNIHMSYPSYNLADLKEINASSTILDYAKGREFRKAGFFDHKLNVPGAFGSEYIKGFDSDPEEECPLSESVSFNMERAYSPSAIDTYLNCPRQFYLKYVLNIEEPDPDDPYTVIDSRDFGTEGHIVMEQFRPDSTLDEVMASASDVFDSFLASRPPISSDSAEFKKQEFLEMIEDAFKSDPKNEPILLENDLRGTHPVGINIHGLPDRVEMTEDGKYIIVDYKTGKTEQHKNHDVVSCLQALVYAFLVEHTKGLTIDHVEFRYPRVGKVISCRWDDDMKDQLSERLRIFKDGLESGNYAPPDKCAVFCKYGDICKRARGEGLNNE